MRAFSSRCRVQLVGQVCRIVPASLPPAACGIHAAANARINTAQLITRTCDVSFERALTAKSCKNYIVTLINGVTRVFVLGPYHSLIDQLTFAFYVNGITHKNKFPKNVDHVKNRRMRFGCDHGPFRSRSRHCTRFVKHFESAITKLTVIYSFVKVVGATSSEGFSSRIYSAHALIQMQRFSVRRRFLPAEQGSRRPQTPPPLLQPGKIL